MSFAPGSRVSLNLGDYRRPEKYKIESIVVTVEAEMSDGRYLVKFDNGATIITGADTLGRPPAADAAGMVRVARYSTLKHGGPAPAGKCHHCEGRIGRGMIRSKVDIGLRGRQTSGKNGRGVFVCETCDAELFDPPLPENTLDLEGTTK